MEEVDCVGDAIGIFSSNNVKSNCNTLTVSKEFFDLILGESVIPKVIGITIGSDDAFKDEESFSIYCPCGNRILLKGIMHDGFPNFAGEVGVITLK